MCIKLNYPLVIILFLKQYMYIVVVIDMFIMLIIFLNNKIQ